MASTESGASTNERPIAFWLVPAAPYHRMFTSVITRLASDYGAVPFEPHITVHAGVRTDDDDVVTLLEAVARTTEEIELTCGPTRHTDSLFKTLLIEFDDARLLPLHRQLRDRLTRRVDYTLQPHLSLLYKELPPAVRNDLASRYVFRGERVLFDRIAAVRPGGGRDDWSDVGRWDVWARRGLRSRATPQEPR